MGAWLDADADLARTVTGVDGFPVAAAFYPQTGGGPIPITGSFGQPPMLEPFAPAGGATVVYFFVYLPDISPQPKKGDRLTINGVSYDIVEVPTVEGGGSTMHLRRN
jgi:hypothetical protein